MKSIYFITGNKGKVIEAKKKFEELDYKIIQKDLGYPEIQADKLEEVALFGVDYLRKKVDHPFVLEDAGLFIDALGGFPGVYSKYVFYKVGCKGILKLLDKNRKAIFRSVFVYSEKGKKPVLFIGETKGHISDSQRGNYGFGYDPIFIPNNEKKTFAEMTTVQKNKLSHRGKALDKLHDFFKNI